MPALVQTASIDADSPRANTSACDIMGASALNRVASASSHTARWWRNAAWVGLIGISKMARGRGAVLSVNGDQVGTSPVNS